MKCGLTTIITYIDFISVTFVESFLCSPMADLIGALF